MGSAANWIIGIIIAVVIVGLGWWALSSKQTAAPNEANEYGTTTEQMEGTASGTDQDQGTAVNVNANVTATTAAARTVEVTYNGTSFSPSSVTIHVGDTVHWTSTSGSMWVASGVHPQHTLYDGTDRAQHCAAGYTGPKPFDECATGNSYSFTFDKAGTWKYHNHVNASATGQVVVR